MIFADPHLSKDKLNAYYDQVQQQEQEKQRISKLTEQLMSKARLKFKLQNKDLKREEQFNKKLEELKKLSTFVDVRSQISKLNLLNDRKLLMKLQVIEKTSKYYQGFKNQKSQADNSMTEDIKYEHEYQRIKDLHVPKRPQTQTVIEELYAPYQEVLNFDTTPRDDTNLFYRKMFKTKRSPEKNKELQIFEEEAQRMKAFLQKQGLLEVKSSSQHQKRVHLRKAPIEDYYKNFQKKCQNIVKQCKFESKRRSEVQDQKIVSSQILQRPRITQCSQDMSARKQRSQTNMSLSPVQKNQLSKRVKSVCESDAPSPLKQRFLKQFETFSQAMSETQCTFKKLNKENKILFNKMSTTMNIFKRQLSQYDQ